MKDGASRRSVAAGLLGALASCATPTSNNGASQLTLEVFTAGENSYGVTSVIVYGPTEAVVIDAQFRAADAQRLADRLDAIGRRVTSIFVTHPDTDHLIGLGVLHERFPQARICMTAAALEVYRQTISPIRAQYLAIPARADEAPPLEPLAEAIAGSTLTVDGQTLQIIADLQGDNASAPTNSVVWVPSLRALIASDIAFQDAHLYLEGSTPEGRAAWRAAIQRLEALNPVTVVAGHKRDAAAPDTPAVLAQSRAYLEAFERRLQQSGDAAALEAAMQQDFADYAFPIFLTISARSVYAAH